MSLVMEGLSGKSYQLNLIDCPGERRRPVQGGRRGRAGGRGADAQPADQTGAIADAPQHASRRASLAASAFGARCVRWVRAGHVNFNDELTAALRLCDGVLLCVDAAEGVMVVTERTIRQAVAEGLSIVLVITKVPLARATRGTRSAPALRLPSSAPRPLPFEAFPDTGRALCVHAVMTAGGPPHHRAQAAARRRLLQAPSHHRGGQRRHRRLRRRRQRQRRARGAPTSLPSLQRLSLARMGWLSAVDRAGGAVAAPTPLPSSRSARVHGCAARAGPCVRAGGPGARQRGVQRRRQRLELHARVVRAALHRRDGRVVRPQVRAQARALRRATRAARPRVLPVSSVALCSRLAVERDKLAGVGAHGSLTSPPCC